MSYKQENNLNALLNLKNRELANQEAAITVLKQRIAELEKEDEISACVIDIQSTLLTGVVNAIRGLPDPLHLHSHHDAIELVENAVKSIAALEAEVAEKTAMWTAASNEVNLLKWEANKIRELPPRFLKVAESVEVYGSLTVIHSLHPQIELDVLPLGTKFYIDTLVPLPAPPEDTPNE